jgi:hypothetical protein
MMTRWMVLGVVVLTAHVSAAPCPQRAPSIAAPQRSAEQAATAKTLFQKGLALQQRGKLEEACKVFESSLLLDPQIGTRLNVAECRELQGNALEAYFMFKDAAADAERFADRRLAYANQRVAALTTKLVTITMKFPTPYPTDVAIKVAGCDATVAEVTSPYLVAPGELVIEVAASGFQPTKIIRNTAPSDQLVIDVPAPVPYANSEEERKAKEEERKAKEAEALAAIERRKAAEIDERRYDRHPARTWMLVTGGVGVAAMIAGTYFTLDAKRAQSSFDDKGCGDRDQLLLPDELQDCFDLRDRGDRSTLLGRSFLIGGGIVTAVSLIVLIADPGNVERPSAAVTVTPRSINMVVRW